MLAPGKKVAHPGRTVGAGLALHTAAGRIAWRLGISLSPRLPLFPSSLLLPSEHKQPFLG